VSPSILSCALRWVSPQFRSLLRHISVIKTLGKLRIVRSPVGPYWSPSASHGLCRERGPKCPKSLYFPPLRTRTYVPMLFCMSSLPVLVELLGTHQVPLPYVHRRTRTRRPALFHFIAGLAVCRSFLAFTKWRELVLQSDATVLLVRPPTPVQVCYVGFS
jgi:hypothetical protein